jgi:hypothetical protein
VAPNTHQKARRATVRPKKTSRAAIAPKSKDEGERKSAVVVVGTDGEDLLELFAVIVAGALRVFPLRGRGHAVRLAHPGRQTLGCRC